MRLYKTFVEANSEIKRDLKEMGIEIHTQTYQDKFIGNREEMATLELQNYIYTVTEPCLEHLKPVQPWADAEFIERTAPADPAGMNPGDAWKLRREVWDEFIQPDGKFGYTYSERLNGTFPNEETLEPDSQLNQMLDGIGNDPDSRQLYMSVWHPMDLAYIGGKRRVPCTLGYLFQVRRGKVNITYLQRSADFATHLQNDMYLACRMQHLVAERSGYAVGNYTHWFGSLHVFKKDVEGVF